MERLVIRYGERYCGRVVPLSVSRNHEVAVPDVRGSF